MDTEETNFHHDEGRCREPVWDQTVIDRLWVTTQREAMIESGPPPTEQQGTTSPVQKTKEPTKK